MVHESPEGSLNTPLDYFVLGMTTSSQKGVIEGDTLQFTRTSLLGCWIAPEKSNETILGYNRNYALRFVDSYTQRGLPVGNELAKTRVTTELLVGRWAVIGMMRFEEEPATILEETDTPAISELLPFIDLNTVLRNNEERFEHKKSSYQAFRDKARELQALDIIGVLGQERTLSGDVTVEGVTLCSVIDDIRNSANSTNNTRLTLHNDCTLWRRVHKSLLRDIDKA